MRSIAVLVRTASARHATAVLAVAALLTFARFSYADSWRPYGVQRFVSDDGRYYVVIRPLPGGESLEPGFQGPRGEFHWVERGDGKPPMKAAREDREGTGGPVAFEAEPGDRSVRRGILPELPLTVLVGNDGRSFVGLEEWARIGLGATVVVAWEQQPIVELTLKDLFSERERNVLRERYLKRWFRAAWLREALGDVILAGTNRTLKAVDLPSGDVRDVAPSELIALLETLPRDERWVVLDVLRDLGHPLDPARLRALLEASESDATRIRAAVWAAERGDEEAKEQVFDVARRAWEGDVVPKDVEFALENLPRVAAPDAVLEAYRAAAREHGAVVDGRIFWGLKAMAERDAMRVLAIASDRAEEWSLRRYAVLALQPDLNGGGWIETIPGLLEIATSEADNLALIAFETAEMIAPHGIAPRAVDLLGRSGVLDRAVADFLTETRWRRAVPGLVDTLSRYSDGRDPHALVLEALRFQTGQDLPDLAAWQRWAKTAAPPTSAFRTAVRAIDEPVHLPGFLGGARRRAALGAVLRARDLLAQAVEAEEAGEMGEAVEAFESVAFVFRASPFDLRETLERERLDLEALETHVMALRARMAAPQRAGR